jgi:superfamily II DNA or RNA helicase
VREKKRNSEGDRQRERERERERERTKWIEVENGRERDAAREEWRRNIIDGERKMVIFRSREYHSKRGGHYFSRGRHMRCAIIPGRMAIWH